MVGVTFALILSTASATREAISDFEKPRSVTSSSLESALRRFLAAGDVDQTLLGDGETPRVSIVVFLSPNSVTWPVIIVLRQYHMCLGRILFLTIQHLYSANISREGNDPRRRQDRKRQAIPYKLPEGRRDSFATAWYCRRTRNVKEDLSFAFIGSDRYGGARHYAGYLGE